MPGLVEGLWDLHHGVTTGPADEQRCCCCRRRHVIVMRLNSSLTYSDDDEEDGTQLRRSMTHRLDDPDTEAWIVEKGQNR